MAEAVFSFILLVVTALYEVPRLRREKFKKELWLFLALSLLALLANIIHGFHLLESMFPSI